MRRGCRNELVMRSGMEYNRYVLAMLVMSCCWCSIFKILDMLSHSIAIGIDVAIRNIVHLCSVSDSCLGLFAPNACEHIGSIPSDSPANTEYPVMFAIAIAIDPAANSTSPSSPRNSIDTIDLV